MCQCLKGNMIHNLLCCTGVIARPLTCQLKTTVILPHLPSEILLNIIGGDLNFWTIIHFVKQRYGDKGNKTEEVFAKIA